MQHNIEEKIRNQTGIVFLNNIRRKDYVKIDFENNLAAVSGRFFDVIGQFRGKSPLQ